MIDTKNERIQKIRLRISAFNAKMRELEAQGFCSGGWDSDTDKVAIVDNRMPIHEHRIAGYMDRDLNIEWRDGYRRSV